MSTANTSSELGVFDLFCSIGGLTYGLQRAGLLVKGGLDIDQSCKYPYEKNCKAKFITEDIRNVNYNDIQPFLEDAKYRALVGCAPCQPFSSHAFKFRKSVTDDKWNLIGEFLRIIHEGMPEIISMENVPNLVNKDIFFYFSNELRKLGYKISYQIVSCARLGVPQSRRRLVLLGSLLGEISLIELGKGKLKTVRQAIGHLEEIKHGDASCDDRLHTCSTLTPINLDRMRASKPGGSWEDWPKNLLPNCYRKSSGKSYRSVYGRMEWDKPGPTLTTQFYRYGTGRYGHPEQDRALSLREGAILQTFPKSYEFCAPEESINFTRIGRHIGNAVPPSLSHVIGKSILKHMEENCG